MIGTLQEAFANIPTGPEPRGIEATARIYWLFVFRYTSLFQEEPALRALGRDLDATTVCERAAYVIAARAANLIAPGAAKVIALGAANLIAPGAAKLIAVGAAKVIART